METSPTDQLRAECKALIDRVANRPYSASLLHKTKQFLEECLNYKANRKRRVPP